MPPERVSYEALLASLADGAAVDWTAVEAAAQTSEERRRYGNLRLVARVAELHRTLPPDADEAAVIAPADRVLADPESWGHLAIRGRLASGSFGRILRAHDPQLNREVALKLLRGDISLFRPIDRLLSEARTLARVRHANVVTVYGADVRDGAAGLWMELVDGQTLEAWLHAHGVMGHGEAAAVGIDLCRALAAVHAAGLVHGDVKAQNVMRETRGRIVLMDFGAGRPQGSDATGVAGTPMYLAPEVLAGEPPTTQSDLYSLGVLLFHLLTGAYPHNGEDLDALRGAHADGRRTWLRDLRPDLPDPLVATIERATDADPARRFATAGEMERALAVALQPPAGLPSRSTGVAAVPATRRFAVGALALLAAVVGLIVWSGRERSRAVAVGIDSIAVLPMKDLSAERVPYLADGLHDQLIATLGQVQSLRVTARPSVMRYKDSTQPAGDIARALGVDAVLESTVTTTGAVREGGRRRVKVDARLMLAGAGAPLWARTFERPAGELQGLENDLARAIAASVSASVTREESARLHSAPQVNPAAEEAYFQGRLQLEGYGAAAAQRALDAFQRALTFDQAHARAHVGAALANISLASNGGMTHQQARARALEHVRRALDIQDDLAEAHAAMGDIDFLYNWNAERAAEEYRRSLDLNASLASARSQYAQLLAATGRFDEALTQASEAQAIEPGGLPTLNGLLLYYRKDYPAAEKAIRDALVRRPDLAGLHILLGRVAEAQGRYQEAVDATRMALQLSASGGVPLRVQLVRLEAIIGDLNLARRHLQELEQAAAQGAVRLTPRDVGYVRLAFGDRDGALKAFARAVDEHDPGMVWLGVDPRVDALRSDPRFQSLLKQLGLS